MCKQTVSRHAIQCASSADVMISGQQPGPAQPRNRHHAVVGSPSRVAYTSTHHTWHIHTYTYVCCSAAKSASNCICCSCGCAALTTTTAAEPHTAVCTTHPTHNHPQNLNTLHRTSSTAMPFKLGSSLLLLLCVGNCRQQQHNSAASQLQMSVCSTAPLVRTAKKHYCSTAGTCVADSRLVPCSPVGLDQSRHMYMCLF